jgi:hypothetical protein
MENFLVGILALVTALAVFSFGNSIGEGTIKAAYGQQYCATKCADYKVKYDNDKLSCVCLVEAP